MDQSKQILSDITVFMKYAKFMPEIERRETWDELVTRNMLMHLKKYPNLAEEIGKAYQFVYAKKVLPSMRSMQFGGKPIELSPVRLYNCSYLPIDDYFAFAEVMFLLLSGCGVGYSVQQHHIKKLPTVKKPTQRKRRFLIPDSIEGWADSIKVLMKAYFFGLSDPEFDFSSIRPKGSLLKTAGGKAPGPQPLKNAIHSIRGILDAKENNSQLTSLETHDILCHIADAVLSGGIRRSAMISLFSFDDQDMIHCKYGQWWEKNPQRARANNSAVAVRHRIEKEDFSDLWKKIELSNAGEPGIYFTNNAEWGANPCCEIALKPFQFCVAGDTKLITKHGIEDIQDVVGSEVEIWNGKKWSKVKPYITGYKDKLYRVSFSDGSYLDATANHKFLVKTRFEKDFREVETVDLIKELKVSKYGLQIPRANVVYSNFGKNEEYAFEYGFFIGDGHMDHGTPKANLYNKDKHIGLRGQLLEKDYFNWNGTCYQTIKLNNLSVDYCSALKSSDGLPYFVFSWNKESILNFFAGWIDADGSQANKGCRLYGKEKQIRDAQLLLTKVGINSSVNLMQDAGTETNLGIRKNAVWYLQIPNASRIPSRRLSLTEGKEPTDKGANQLIKEIVELDGLHMSFCLTEEELHQCVFNNVLTKQCNLCEVNVSDVSTQEEYEERVKVASFIGTLQAGYTDFHYIRDIWRETTEKESLLGIGMTGIASGAVLKLDMKKAAKVAKQENERVAKAIGINKAARITTVKPSGCQVKDTMVATKQGILSLEEIGNTESDEVWQEHSYDVFTDVGVKKSSKFYINGFSSTKKILLDSGLELESTPNHKYRVLREGKYVWCRADEILPGDKLPYSVGEYDGGKYQFLNFVKFNRHPQAHNLKDFKQPEILDENLAWFVGLYFGDGSNHTKGIRIHGNKLEKKGLEKAKEIVLDRFGIKGIFLEESDKDNGTSLYFNSVNFVPFLEANGLSKNKSTEIEIPISIRMSPRSVIEAFIDGYYTADGCDKTRSLSACTTSKKFANQLVVVLRSIGRDAKMRLMPPTSSSFGKNMRYWISERKGRMSEHRYISKELKECWSELDDNKLNHMSVDVVVEILDSENYTYDIQVDDSQHTYLANSYVSHNTSSLVLGCSSGIHAWHAPYYIRRIRVMKNESIYQYLAEKMPSLVEDDYFNPQNQAVIAIPVKAPDGAIIRTESSHDLLERVKKVYSEWVKEGHRSGHNTNNVSATISIKPEEWDHVGEWMWSNRNYYNGLSVIPYDNGSYVQAPFEEITKEKYDQMISVLTAIDLSEIVEKEDNTNLADQIACQGGACEIVAA